MSNNEFELAKTLLSGSLSLEGLLLVALVYIYSARNTGIALRRNPNYIKNLWRFGWIFVFILFINTLCVIFSYFAVYKCNNTLFYISTITFFVSIISIPIWSLLILLWEK